MHNVCRPRVAGRRRYAPAQIPCTAFTLPSSTGKHVLPTYMQAIEKEVYVSAVPSSLLRPDIDLPTR
jgi:hypothetical protein